MHQLGNGENSRLEGLIESYELAFRMQTSVPNTIDISKESKQTLENMVSMIKLLLNLANNVY